IVGLMDKAAAGVDASPHIPRGETTHLSPTGNQGL
ncbi:hypothetical protein PSYMO_38303, partial [Pseudomonas amygdali pv. mori str. 301020]